MNGDKIDIKGEKVRSYRRFLKKDLYGEWHYLVDEDKLLKILTDMDNRIKQLEWKNKKK